MTDADEVARLADELTAARSELQFVLDHFESLDKNLAERHEILMDMFRDALGFTKSASAYYMLGEIYRLKQKENS